MSDSATSDIETLEIKQPKLSINSNGHNFSHWGPIQAHHISRRSKLNNGSSWEIEIVICYHTDVRLRNITYRDNRNCTHTHVGTSVIETLNIKQWKLSRNSNGHNFSKGGPIQAHHISRRSKLNNGSSWEIEIVITLHSDVRFKHITYGDARNWTTEDLQKFKWS